MKRNATKVNILLQTAYQVFALLIPFITAPYISRVLGTERVGVFSYNYSIVNYFMLAEMLGLEVYGARSIARAKENRDLLDASVSEIYTAHIMVSVLVLAAYLVYTFCFSGVHKLISVVQTVYILGQMLNVSWVYTGLSEHRVIVLRNLAVKTVMVILVFTMVKSEEDLIIYVAISAAEMFVSQALLWTMLKKYCSLRRVAFKSVLKHFKPQVILFVSIIAGSVYRMMDKTMLGAMGMMSDLGKYEYADKIVNMPLSVVAAVGTVMLSKTSNMFLKGEDKQVFGITRRMLWYMTLFSSLMVFGMIAYGRQFSVVYLGREYEFTGTLLAILAITVVLISWNSTLRTQYFIPQCKDKYYVYAVLIGAAVNMALNFLLIPVWHTVGAAAATVVSYLVVFSLELFFARRDLHPGRLLAENALPFLVGAVPFALSFLWKRVLGDGAVSLVVQIAIFCIEFALVTVGCLALTGKLWMLLQLLPAKRDTGQQGRT